MLKRRNLARTVMAVLLCAALAALPGFTAGAVAEGDTAAVAGYYDQSFMGMTNPEVSLILSEDGHGQLVTRDESLVFTYKLEANTVVPEGEGFTLSPSANGQLIANGLGEGIAFARRTNPTDENGFAGQWEFTQISDESLLEAGTLEVTARGVALVRKNGANDLALGWGADAQGLYLRGGRTFRVTVTGNEAILMTDAGDAARMCRSGASTASVTPPPQQPAQPEQPAPSVDGTAAGLARKGLEAAAKGEDETAFQYLRQAVDQGEQDIAVYETLGAMYLDEKLGHYDPLNAQACFESAMKLGSASEETLRRVADLASGLIPGAALDYTEALDAYLLLNHGDTAATVEMLADHRPLMENKAEFLRTIYAKADAALAAEDYSMEQQMLEMAVQLSGLWR